ncbi:MAG: transporter substrate-binding domain-containing protein, partial [Clostridia bacterium]|nr:transporter substrate-binding domain-containing protein [Clostridia bacterium]
MAIATLLLVVACAAPAEVTAPAEATAPAEEAAPTEEAVPVEEAAPAQEDKVLRVASAGDYLGFTVYDETTQTWSGFEIDMWTEIAKRTGYELELIQEDVATAFGDLDNARVDTVAKQISITPARQEKYDFTTPYFFSPYSLMVPGDSDITCWADMEGKTIGLADGSAMNEFVERLDPDNKVKKSTYEAFST